MSDCRMHMNLWKWLFGDYKDWKFFFKNKLWKSDYFWHDSFWQYWNRWIGCKIIGHRREWMANGGCLENKPHYYCFRCNQVIDCKNESIKRPNSKDKNIS